MKIKMKLIRNKTSLYIKLLSCLSYGFIINSIYRPYIYVNKIYDFGLADIGNNLLFIPTSYYLIKLFSGNNFFPSKTNVLLQFIILSFFEIISLFLPYFGTFDIKDILALLFGTLTVLFLEFNELKSE